MTEFLIILIIILALVCVMTVLIGINIKNTVLPVISVFCCVMIIFCGVFLGLKIKNGGEETPSRSAVPVTEYRDSDTASGESAEETTEAEEPEAEQNSEAPKSGGDTVYFTKSGKKYHYSYECGDYEFYECTLDEALEMGLEPCEKCAE